MNDITKAIFQSNHLHIPEKIEATLYTHFQNAINIEWNIIQGYYEAVFYLSDIEHIAKISENGELIEFKKNLWLSELPDLIATKCSDYGEIMSVIAIYSASKVCYELVMQKPLIVRHLLLFDEIGNLLSVKELNVV